MPGTNVPAGRVGLRRFSSVQTGRGSARYQVPSSPAAEPGSGPGDLGQFKLLNNIDKFFLPDCIQSAVAGHLTGELLRNELPLAEEDIYANNR